MGPFYKILCNVALNIFYAIHNVFPDIRSIILFFEDAWNFFRLLNELHIKPR